MLSSKGYLHCFIFTYCVVFHHGVYLQNFFNKLQVLQNRALRIIVGRDWNTSVFGLHHTPEILSVEQLYLLEVGKLLYLFDVKKLPLPFANYFDYISYENNKYSRRGVLAKL